MTAHIPGLVEAGRSKLYRPISTWKQISYVCCGIDSAWMSDYWKLGRIYIDFNEYKRLVKEDVEPRVSSG